MADVDADPSARRGDLRFGTSGSVCTEVSTNGGDVVAVLMEQTSR